MNGHGPYVASIVTLCLAVLGLAFWLGTQAQEIAGLKAQVELASPLNNDHRITVLEAQVSELDRTCIRKLK